MPSGRSAGRSRNPSRYQSARLLSCGSCRPESSYARRCRWRKGGGGRVRGQSTQKINSRDKDGAGGGGVIIVCHSFSCIVPFFLYVPEKGRSDPIQREPTKRTRKRAQHEKKKLQKSPFVSLALPRASCTPPSRRWHSVFQNNLTQLNPAKLNQSKLDQIRPKTKSAQSEQTARQQQQKAKQQEHLSPGFVGLKKINIAQLSQPRLNSVSLDRRPQSIPDSIEHIFRRDPTHLQINPEYPHIAIQSNTSL